MLCITEPLQRTQPDLPGGVAGGVVGLFGAGLFGGVAGGFGLGFGGVPGGICGPRGAGVNPPGGVTGGFVGMNLGCAGCGGWPRTGGGVTICSDRKISATPTVIGSV